MGLKKELHLLVDLAVSSKLKAMTNTKHRSYEVNKVLAALKDGKVLGRANFDPILKYKLEKQR